MSLRKHVKEENVQLFRKLVEELLEILKAEDPLFKKSFRSVLYTSSYWKNDFYEALPNEIDLHLQMQFPIKEEQIQTKKSKSKDWVHLKLKGPINEASLQRKWRHLLPQMTEFFDEEKRMYLLRTKVNEWQKAILDKALGIFIRRKHPSGIEFCRSRVSNSKKLRFKSKIGEDLLYVNIVVAIGIPHSATVAVKTQNSVCPNRVMLLCKEPPSLVEESFSNQLFGLFIPKMEEKIHAIEAKALQKVFKETEWFEKWDFLTCNYLQILLLCQLQHGSVNKLEKSSFVESWNKVFSKMLVEFFEEVGYDHLFKPPFFKPSSHVRQLAQILREAKDSPYQVAESILTKLQSLCN